MADSGVDDGRSGVNRHLFHRGSKHELRIEPAHLTAVEDYISARRRS